MRKRHSPACRHEHTGQHSPVCRHEHTGQLGSRRGGLTGSLYYSLQILFLKLLDFLILSFALFLQEFELMNVLVVQKLQISCLVCTFFQCSFQLLKWERWKDQDIGTKLRGATGALQVGLSQMYFLLLTNLHIITKSNFMFLLLLYMVMCTMALIL